MHKEGISERLDWVVGFEAICLLLGPGPLGEVPSVGVFLRDPRKNLCEFRRKLRKTQ